MFHEYWTCQMMCTFLSTQCETQRPVTFLLFTQTLFKWRCSIHSVINAVQIRSSTAAKNTVTVPKVTMNEPLPYLILKLFSVQLIPDPAGYTPDLAMGFLPSHGSEFRLKFPILNISCMLGHPLAVVWNEPTDCIGWETCAYKTTIHTQTLPPAELTVFSNFFFHYKR